LPNITESKNGLHVSDDLHRNPKPARSNPKGSIEPRLRTTALDGSISLKLFQPGSASLSLWLCKWNA